MRGIISSLLLAEQLWRVPRQEACIRTDRSYVGMELSREYFEISRSRLTEALAAQSSTA